MDKVCKNCKHSELMFAKPKDRYCINEQCDIDVSNDEECDNYMGIVEDDDSCKLFEEHKDGRADTWTNSNRHSTTANDPLRILREDTYTNEETDRMVGNMIRKQFNESVK